MNTIVLKIAVKNLFANKAKLIITLSLIGLGTFFVISGLGILNFAMNYGGRRDIILAIQELAKSGQDLSTLTEEDLSKHLQTAVLPENLRDPDLIIRTSGEQRMSNFLTWQSAYSELYFAQTAWPDFDEAELDKAIAAFQKRDRRYGGVK